MIYVAGAIAIYIVSKILIDFTFFREEINAALDRDPAAKNPFEVTFFYSGFKALKYHRIAHGLQRMKVPALPIIFSRWARLWTGIEIHPGAQIGKGLFIDHGMGVVIGETTIIGENATLFQQVTLGGTGKEQGKRHPTLGKNVVVGAGAKVLGNIRIGDDVFIGANAVVVRDVPSSATVVGVPGRITTLEGRRLPGIHLDHTHLPDPLQKALQKLQHEIDHIEDELKEQHKNKPKG